MPLTPGDRVLLIFVYFLGALSFLWFAFLSENIWGYILIPVFYICLAVPEFLTIWKEGWPETSGNDFG